MITCIVSSPVDTYSGYGRRSVDFIKQLIRVRPDWDIKLLSQSWGISKKGYLKDHNEEDLLSRIITKVSSRPDVWIQITTPNEFQATGYYNVGVTAAMETTLCDYSWVEGCNRMDLVIVSSKHSEFSLKNSVYDVSGKNVSVSKPIEVLFEGIDTNIYKKLEDKSIKDIKMLSEIDTTFNFLCVGHWLTGNYGNDRKNIWYTVKMFLETFKDIDNAPGLILKTSRASSSILDKDEILNRLYLIRESMTYEKCLPNVYLLHGDLTDEEMNELYNDSKVKAMISFTKGEGFGRPLLEFSNVGKPIICSGWSGQLDFLHKDMSLLVGGKITPVDPSSYVRDTIIKGSKWFTPDDEQVTRAFKMIYGDYATWKKAANRQMSRVSQNFTLDKMGSKLDRILTEYVITEKLLNI